MGLGGEPKKVLYTLIEFYLSLVAYFILHMIFVIASDFVEAFNIPPLNIGIYVDKLAAIRALLMVLSDFIEWGITQKGLGDGGNANQSLFGNDKDDWFTEWSRRTSWHNSHGSGPGSRRIASILSFIGMLVCRCVYLYLVYKSDNKSLSVFITLCLEGFWFGLFQMGFFAIGPEYNAYTSFGIHTMGNIIFFMQVILNYYAKKKPKINCLYRVRVHAWIVVVTSIIGLILWVCFCFWANAGTGEAPNNWPEKEDVWSPFLLFIIGAFAEDFAVPGILPFAFLDPEKANLVNYLTPSFFMTGAMVTVIFNDWWTTINYKAWSASKGAKEDKDENGMYWHSLWLLNIPKYIAFFIAMFSIHGTYDSLRCIIQSRWRVMWLTLTVVVPRAVLETSGYVGVANWSIGRADFGLVEGELIRAIGYGLKEGRVTGFPVEANTLRDAIGEAANSDPKNVKEALASWIKFKYFASIEATNIEAKVEQTSGKVKVEIKEESGASSGTEGSSEAQVVTSGTTNSGVKVTITGIGGKDEAEKQQKAKEIANRIASFVAVAALTHQLNTDGEINSTDKLKASDIKTKLGSAKDQISKLVTGYNGAEVHNANTGIDVPAVHDNKVTVEFKMSKQFNTLVEELKTQVQEQLKSKPSSAEEISGKLKNALDTVKNSHLKELAKSMVVGTKTTKVESVVPSTSGNTVTVKIGSGQTQKGESATVEVKNKTNNNTATVEIKVMGNASGDGELTKEEGTAIANVVALALVNKTVTEAVNDYTITMTKPKDNYESVTGNSVSVKGPAGSFQIQVKIHKSLAKNGESASFVSTELAKLVRGAAVAASLGKGRAGAYTDFPAFDWIAWHDVTAMFCRFVYGKFAVGYKSTIVTLKY